MAVVENNLPANVGDLRHVGFIFESGRSPGGGHGNPLQYPSLENLVDEGAGGLQFIAPQRVRHD